MKKNKEPKWSKYKDGYRSNMSEKELNEYQERTGRRVEPPRDNFSLFSTKKGFKL